MATFLVAAIIGWILLVLLYLISELRDTKRVRILVALFDDARKNGGDKIWKHETIMWILDRLDVDPVEFKKADIGSLFGNQRNQVIKTMTVVAADHGRKEFLARDLLPTLYHLSPAVRDVFAAHHIDYEDLQLVSAWWEMEQEKGKERFLDKFAREKPLGYKLLAGYTLEMDKYARSINEAYDTKRSQFHLSAHRKALHRLQGILTQSGFNNALVIGDPGIGKRALLFALAQLIERGRARPGLNLRRLIVLDIERMGDRVGDVFAEAERAGNVIIVIENIERFVGKKSGFNIAEAIIPFIRSQRLQLIALTTPGAFADNISRDKQLTESFVQLKVGEPSVRETMMILFDVLEDIERRVNITVTYPGLKALTNLSDRYVSQGKRPQKVIALLDQLVSWLDARPGKTPERVNKTHVERFLSELFGVSIGAGDKQAAEQLLTLERAMHRDVIGQDNAITAVANALRRRQAALSTGQHTVGNFLFIGPTGVGKTSVAKALAKHYYDEGKKGSDEHDAFVYLNMTEYSGSNAVAQLIGTRDNPGGTLTNAVLQNQFSLLLLDELEKASKEVLNVLLQILDEGRLIGPRQEEIDFRHVIVIATSNAGAQLIHEAVKANRKLDNPIIRQSIVDHILRESVFAPEFMNRFDDVILFHPLSRADLRKIARVELKGIASRMDEQHGVKISFAKDVIDYVIETGYTPEFGARQLHRVIQDKIESALAKMVLNGSIKTANDKAKITISMDMLY